MSDKADYTYSVRTGNLSFIVFAVFLILKLTGVIDWSWWWVTSPLWITAAVVIAVILIVLALVLLWLGALTLVGFIDIISDWKTRRNKW